MSTLIGFRIWHQPSSIERPKALIKHLFFIENQGQWEGPHKYKANLGPATLFAEQNAITYLLIDARDLPKHGAREPNATQLNNDVDCHAYRVQFVGANEHVKIKGRDKMDAYHNYYLGNDSTRWKGNVPLYHGLYYQNLYQGIDLEFYQNNVDFKYDFIVHAGASAEDIKLNYEGHSGLYVKEGALHIKTSIDEVIEAAPYCYQLIGDKKIAIPCNYVLNEDNLSFNFPNGYSVEHDLIIDPVLVFSTFTGATEDNWGMSSTFDLNGNAYGGGISFGQGFPVTLGAFQSNFAGFQDIALAKFSGDGTQLVYATYIGGMQDESPQSMIVNSQDQVIIAGSTSSEDFPLQNPFDDQLNDGANTFRNDLFITVVNSDGTALIGSTFVGGADEDGSISFFELAPNYEDEKRCEVIIDEDDNIYVALSTESADFPTTTGCLQPTLGGGLDGAVIKMSPDASQMLMGTYYGGSSNDFAAAIRIDDNGDLFVSGSTQSNDLTMTGNGFQTTSQGLIDGYLIKMNNAGDQLLGATYMGTPENDFCFLIDLDEDGAIYAVGLNNDGTYPISGNVYSEADGINFIQQFSSDLTSSDFSTKFGDKGDDLFGSFSVTAFLVDECNRIYVSGWGEVQNYTVTSDAFQSNADPISSDFYLVVFEANAAAMEYGTFFGSDGQFDHVDGGTSRFDNRGIIYQSACAGCGGTSDFPISSDAYSTTNNSFGCNNAVFKFDFQLNEIVTSAAVSAIDTGCNPVQVFFNQETEGPVDNYIWYFGDGDTSTLENPNHAYFNGQYTVTLITTSNISCVEPDTTILELDIVAPVLSNYSEIQKCALDTTPLQSTSPFTIVSTTWQDNTESAIYLAVDTGLYVAQGIQDNNCVFIDSFRITHFPTPTSVTNRTLCPMDTITLTSPVTDMGSTYSWNTGETTASIDVQAAGTYVVSSKGMACTQIDTFIVSDTDYSNIYSQELIKCGDSIVTMTVTEMNNLDYVVWSTGENTTSISTQNAGTITATTFYTDRCAVIDTFKVLDYDVLPSELTTFDLCENQSTEITSPKANTATLFLWNTGETTATITANGPGVYSVRATNPICAVVDTFILTPAATVPPTLDTIVLCEGDQSTIESTDANNTDATFLWSTGESTNSIVIRTAGTYEVTATQGLRCPIVNRFSVSSEPRTTRDDFYFPNAFSPNDDGINEQFRPFFSDRIVILEYELLVFDRWGNRVFKSDTPALGWNGFLNGKEQETGVYVYQCRIKAESCMNEIADILFHGDISIVK